MTSQVPPIWKQKLCTLFTRFDKHQKGHVTKDDIISQVEAFEKKGFLNSAEGGELRNLFGKLWSFFLNGRDSVNLDQWIESHLTLIFPGTPEVDVWETILKRAATLMFRAADKQRSGLMSLDDFSTYLTCLGVDGRLVGNDIFKRINPSDGGITEDVFLNMFHDFVYNKEDTPNKELMGPLCC